MSVRPPRPSSVTRTRAAEALAPRPTDLLARRLSAAAAVARLTEARLAALTPAPSVDGLDASSLDALAAAQQRDEDELLARWEYFRGYYTSYLATMRARASTLSRALDVLSAVNGAHHGPAKVRSALRTCRMRRPPLAKVEALVAEARALDAARAPGQNIITQTS